MADGLLHFVHTPLFEETAEGVLGDDGLRAAQEMIRANPDVGTVIKGTGGALTRLGRYGAGSKSGGENA